MLLSSFAERETMQRQINTLTNQNNSLKQKLQIAHSLAKAKSPKCFVIQNSPNGLHKKLKSEANASNLAQIHARNSPKKVLATVNK